MPHIIISDKSDQTVTVHGASMEQYLELCRARRSGEGVRVRLNGDNQNTFYGLKEIFWPAKEVRKIEYVEGPNSE